jgi:hypothetical protein
LINQPGLQAKKKAGADEIYAAKTGLYFVKACASAACVLIAIIFMNQNPRRTPRGFDYFFQQRIFIFFFYIYLP